MNSNTPMSVADLLCYIRQQLIDARQQEDKDNQLGALLYTLTVIDEAAAHNQDATYTKIVEDLIYAVQHSFIAEHKVTIPSVEEIKAASSTST